MMRHAMYVVGSDPGIANFGIAVGLVTAVDLRIIRLTTWTTAKSSPSSVGDDKSRRTRELATKLAALIRSVEPVSLVTEELSKGMPNASTQATVERIFGMIDGVIASENLARVAIPPRSIKALCPGEDRSKDAVEAAVRPYVEAMALAELETKGRPDYQPASKRDHAFDAAGAIVASMVRPEMISLRKSLAAMDARPLPFGVSAKAWKL